MLRGRGIERARSWLPILDWGRRYDRATLVSDLLAAVIVTLMLIPQSLAYASLAGLPPEVGLYASVVPLLLYALFGTSRVLAVGPVAVVSLMTATAVAEYAVPGSPQYWSVAITLAFLSGAMLILMGFLRLGFLASFLSHPVISGFITASALLIAAGQLKVILGIKTEGHDFFELLWGLMRQWQQINGLSAAVGLGTVAFLFWTRRGLKSTLLRLGVGPRLSDALTRAAPVAAIAMAALLTGMLGWQEAGLRIVGVVPQGLPPLTAPLWDIDLWRKLALAAFLISVVGFVESVSVGQTLAARRRQRIDPDRELVALGASNLGASMTGGFPVTGGFSRSVVNFDAGAQTPAAGVFTAAGILLAALLLTPALYFVPQATLAATIVVAVLSLVDLRIFRRTWSYSKTDFAAGMVTVLVTLTYGVEPGLVTGVLVSLLLFLFKTSRPHIAEVGLVAGTEHFRNVRRHQVTVSPRVLSLRVDESLYFANIRALEDWINEAVASRPELEHLVLQCSAVNDIDASALEGLQTIDLRLRDAGMLFHLSEVKGPVMDRLKRSDFLQQLSGQVFLTHFQAVAQLAPEMISPAQQFVSRGA
jgi:SulP family sulfate permease